MILVKYEHPVSALQIKTTIVIYCLSVSWQRKKALNRLFSLFKNYLFKNTFRTDETTRHTQLIMIVCVCLLRMSGLAEEFSSKHLYINTARENPRKQKQAILSRLESRICRFLSHYEFGTGIKQRKICDLI